MRTAFIIFCWNKWLRMPNTFFCQCKILSLQALYYESVRSLMYDVNRNSAPENIELFSRISSVHTYNTSTFEHFYTKESRLKVKRNAFLRVGVKIWNRIPQILKKNNGKNFQKIIKSNATRYIAKWRLLNWCRYDYSENEKVILLSFIFISFCFYNSLQYFPCI